MKVYGLNKTKAKKDGQNATTNPSLDHMPRARPKATLLLVLEVYYVITPHRRAANVEPAITTFSDNLVHFRFLCRISVDLRRYKIAYRK